MLLVLAIKENVRMNIYMKYTKELKLKLFTSVLFSNTYYSIEGKRLSTKVRKLFVNKENLNCIQIDMLLVLEINIGIF